MSRRLWVWVACGAVSLVVVATTTMGYSGGAPEAAAADGCTCHSPEATPTVTIALEGIPDHYVRNTRYDVTLRIDGGAPPLPPPAGQNQGGFAIQGDAKWGRLEPVDDTTQLAGTEFLTHTAAGNDQREWRFAWTSADADFQEFEGITFHISVNAVNGNAVQDPLDAWTHAERFFEATHPEADPFGHLDGDNGTAANETGEASGGGTPGFTLGYVALAALGTFLAVRGRGRFEA